MRAMEEKAHAPELENAHLTSLQAHFEREKAEIAKEWEATVKKLEDEL